MKTPNPLTVPLPFENSTQAERFLRQYGLYTAREHWLSEFEAQIEFYKEQGWSKDCFEPHGHG